MEAPGHGSQQDRPKHASRWVLLGHVTLNPSAVDGPDSHRDRAQMAALGQLPLPEHTQTQAHQAVGSHLAALRHAGRPVHVTVWQSSPVARRTEEAAAPGWGLFTVVREVEGEGGQPLLVIELFLYPADHPSKGHP